MQELEALLPRTGIKLVVIDNRLDSFSTCQLVAIESNYSVSKSSEQKTPE